MLFRSKFLAQQSDNSLTVAKKELAAGLKKYPSGEKRKQFLIEFSVQQQRSFVTRRIELYVHVQRSIFLHQIIHPYLKQK